MERFSKLNLFFKQQLCLPKTLIMRLLLLFLIKKIIFFFNKYKKMFLPTPQKLPIFVMQSETIDLIRAQMKGANAHIRKAVRQVMVMTILLVAFLNAGLAQGWEVSFGGVFEESAAAILQTEDEGFIEVGFSQSFGSDSDFDIYIVRTDVDGTEIWSTFYDESNVEHGRDVIQLEDHNFLVLGFINDIDPVIGATPTQVYLMKIDDKGEKLWSHRYENSGMNQRGTKIIATSDGGYAIIGSTIESGETSSDILLIKLDSNADEVWRRVYGDELSQEAQDLLEVENGFVFVANEDEDQSAYDDVAIYRVDETGNIISVKRYGESGSAETVNDLLQTSDGNIVLVGASNNDNNSFFIKSDLNGDTLWTREIVGSIHDDPLSAVTELKDGALVATGQSYPDGIDPKVLLIKLSAEGQLIWRKTLGSEFSVPQFGEDIALAADGGFVIAATSSKASLVFINDMTIIKLDGEGNFYTNLLEGKVFLSTDGCNPYEEGDLDLEGWFVQVEGEDNQFVGSTDAEGNYSIPVDIGSFTVSLLPKNDTWDICSPSSFPVDFTAIYDTLVYNFPVRSAIDNCPLLTVEVSTGILQACSDATYTIEYCNDGSALAENAFVEIELDEELTYVNASIDPSTVVENTLVFQLGDLAVLECGSFTVNVQVACDEIEELQAVSFTTNIFPDTTCSPLSPDWDGAKIEVKGRCEDNQIVFSAKNVGDNPTDVVLGYIIVEDVLMFLNNGEVPILPPGTEVDLGMPITPNEIGSTYRLIAMQSEGAPGNNYPTVFVEGCTQEGNENFTTGMVTQFPDNDQDPYSDIDVQEILTTSGTANILISHPKGYQDSIITQSTDIEYTILFANTTVDTLNRLVIRDTLPAELDLATLSVGPASHPYNAELYNGGILKITFNDLHLLPDGSGEVTDSRGFVKLTLSQKPNLLLGTVIDNSAAVYFDYVAPIITNKVRHVIACEDFLTVGCITVGITEPPVVKGINIRVQPNPTHTSADFIIENCEECGQVEMILRDAHGREVRREQYAGSEFTFQRKNLVPALYFFELRSNGQILQTGKLLIQ